MPTFLAKAVGPVDKKAPLTRTTALVAPNAVVVATAKARLSLAASGVHGSWTRHRHGATRRTAFGDETVVFAKSVTEEFLTVRKHHGDRTWSWKLDTHGARPRVGVDGGVSLRAGHTLLPLAVAPVAILNSKGRDVTPRGLRWTVVHENGSWWLRLRLNDSKLRVPYVIDPAITHRVSRTSNNGTAGASSITLTLPTGVATRDLLVAQISARGGSSMSIATPAGWTAGPNATNGANVRQAIFYKVAGTTEPASVTFTFGGGTRQAVGGIAAYYGVKSTQPVDTFSASASSGTSSTATAASINTVAAGSLVVGAFASATGTSFSTPSGMTERYDAQSGSSSTSSRSTAAQFDVVQANAGATGSKSASVGFSSWLARLLSFRVDNVGPAVTQVDPGANLRGTITLTANASDGDSGIQSVQFQGAAAGTGAWANVGAPELTAPYQISVDTTPTPDGLYDLRAVATDFAGNVTASAVVANRRVDNTAPTAAVTFPAEGAPYGSARWAAGCNPDGLCGTVSDAGSGPNTVEVSVRRSSTGLYWNGTSFASSTEVFRPATRSGTSWTMGLAFGSFPGDGTYTARARSTDVAGNSGIGATRTFTVDTVAPSTSITSGPASPTSSTSAQLAFSSSEAGTFECRRDGAAFAACTSPISYSGLAEGTHTVEVRATDTAGNTDASPASYSWFVDRTGPSVGVTAPAAGSSVHGVASLAANATDNDQVAGVQFKVDGVNAGAEDTSAPFTGSFNSRLYTAGTHTVSAVARDRVGNTTTSTQVGFTVDNSGFAGPGLVAGYGFDEGQGATAADGSGHGNTANLVGAGWATGKFGSSLFADGIDDRADMPALGTFYNDGFTLEAWVMKRGTRKDVTVLGSWEPGDGGPMIWVDHVNGRYYLTFGPDYADYLDSGRAPVIGQWQHVAATYDGTTARFYVDGVEVASKQWTSEIGTSNTWRIGASRADGSRYWDGLVDEVRVYDRALPAAEVAADKTESVGPADRAAPTTPTGLALVSATGSTVKVKWNASTDNLRVAGYNVYRDGALATTTTALSTTLTGLACSHAYTVAVEAFDGVGNKSAKAQVNVSTSACDTTAPTVGIVAPSNGTVVGGTVAASAVASDGDRVVGVQFKLDGGNVGAEDTTAPYSVTWNTRMSTSGAHTLSAVARDPAGNLGTAQIQVTVDNNGAPGPGLVAGYGFDEGTGTAAADISGDGHGATLVGAGWAAGKFANAASFDGNDDRVDLPALGTFYRAGFTFEAWVNKGSARKDEAVVGTWDGGGPMIWVDHVTGHYRLTLGTDFDGYLDSGQAPVPGTWQHVAATWNGTTARFFVDGVEVANKTFAGDIGSSNAWHVGAYRSSPVGFWDGLIDEVRIYDRALPAAEVQADMTASVAPDRYPPSVESMSPEEGTTGVAAGAVAKATFSEVMDPATITDTTFTLRDAGGQFVPASVSYNAATRTATLTPTDALVLETKYTATLAGGTAGVSDAAGNPLRSTQSWSFTTRKSPPPILIVTSDANPFADYTRQLFKAEGVDAFDTLDVTQLSASALTGFDVVVLGDVPVTDAQVATLTTWVQSGGNLVAFHPDKKLASLLGLTDAGGTLANGYLRVDTSADPGTGITGDTMQFHGTADRYTLAGARAVATLYSNATTATSNPAVTVRDVGSNGGQAAAFTFDLSRSIVYTRQGNPAWVGQERDGEAGIRPNDLFYGASATDPQPDWLDTSKIAIPQADEQQRLLVNLVTSIERDRKPVPRFWYFPRDLRAAVVMTGDDHAVGGTVGRFDQYIAASRPDCSVVDWECVRATSYMYSNGPMTDAQARAYIQAGFEIALHVAINNGCGEWTPAEADSIFASQLLAFSTKYPSVPSPVTNRTHCVTWDDWATEPKTELMHGIGLDTNYYAYPASWIATKPGFMTGSGIPMKFADSDGSTIGVYQAMTQMDDEADQEYPATVNALLDKALGADGYYGFFVVNMHTDLALSPGSDAIVAAAQARGVPVISSKQLLDWLEARDASKFDDLKWDGSKITFSIAADDGANGLRAMLPRQARGGTLSALTRDGAPVTFDTKTIKGVEYAVFPADDGAYAATYS
jgi:hypothetical protein